MIAMTTKGRVAPNPPLTKTDVAIVTLTLPRFSLVLLLASEIKSTEVRWKSTTCFVEFHHTLPMTS